MVQRVVLAQLEVRVFKVQQGQLEARVQQAFKAPQVQPDQREYLAPLAQPEVRVFRVQQDQREARVL